MIIYTINADQTDLIILLHVSGHITPLYKRPIYTSFNNINNNVAYFKDIFHWFLKPFYPLHVLFTCTEQIKIIYKYQFVNM